MDILPAGKRSRYPLLHLEHHAAKNKRTNVHTLQKLCAGFGITLEQFFSTADKSVAFSQDQCKFLAEWNQLDDAGKQLALAYMQGLRDRQNTK